MDKIASDRRSANMRAIRAKHTKPEMLVRQVLRKLGFKGYRLHRADLPGKPDVAFIGRRKAILVHGCFWHGHDCRVGSRRPQSRKDYWLPKIGGNQARDARDRAALAAAGWEVLVVWECQLRDAGLPQRLTEFMTLPAAAKAVFASTEVT